MFVVKCDKVFNLTIVCFLVILFIINPIRFFAPKYSIIFLLIITLFVIAATRWKLLKIQKIGRWFYLFMLFHLVLFLFYWNNITTVINILSLLISYMTLYYLVVMAIKYNGVEKFQKILFKSIIVLAFLSFLVSIFLTMFKWSSAPTWFPWESVGSNKRLLLIDGKSVGHSPIIWLMVFALSFLFKMLAERKGNKLFIIFIITFFIFCLIESKTRISLILIIWLLLCSLAYWKYFSVKYMVLILIIIVGSFFLSVVKPTFYTHLTHGVRSVQEYIPFLRIDTGSSDENLDIYAGRLLLNLSLINLSIENPWIGVGHSHQIIQYGITAQDTGQVLASSETVLRMLAKYGLIYFILMLVFILTPMWRAVRGYYKDNVFVISVCGVIILTGLSSSLMENLYGTSGFFAIFLILFHFQKREMWKNRNLAGVWSVRKSKGVH